MSSPATQAEDYAHMRGHYDATRPMDRLLRLLMASAEGRKLAGHPDEEAYKAAVSERVSAVDKQIHDIVNDDLDLVMDLTKADTETINDALVEHLAEQNLQEVVNALQSATEEFEAIVAYAYHVSRLSYGKIARVTGKSKSSILEIVKRNRHLEVLAPEVPRS